MASPLPGGRVLDFPLWGRGTSIVTLDSIPVEEGKQGFLCLLTLNRPEAANAFNSEMIGGLIRALTDSRLQEPGCRALILRGAGPNFCAGADLKEMGAMGTASWEENLAQAERVAEIYRLAWACPVPTIALVRGSCFGGGVGLVAAVDWAIAQPDTRFCLSEVRVGAVAGVILPYLIQKVQTGQLRRWVITAQTIGAEEAYTAGLVQKVSTDVGAEVARLLEGSPEAQRVFKKTHRSLLPALSQEMPQLLAKMRASTSGQEGVQAFLRKRSPHWKAKVPSLDWWG